MTLGEAFTALGYLTGAIALLLAARRRRMMTEGMLWVAIGGLAASAIGAKLTEWFAEGWPTRIPLDAAFDPRLGGRALAGGLIAGWIGVEIVKRRLGIKRSTGDLFALALPLGEGIGRIGCYFNGCCYGSPWNGPWAIWQHGAWRHPAQIYSSVSAFALFGLLLWLRPRLTEEGALFKAYLLGFGATRLTIEFLRWRESVVLGLSPMQWFCLDLIVYSSVSLVLMARRRARAQEA